MMESQDLLTDFYEAFTRGDAARMAQHYHPQAEFSDPAFGRLVGEEIAAMWHMLLANKESSELQIRFEVLEASERQGKVKWIANYRFGPQKRAVENHIWAAFELKNGKIIRHQDRFNRWKWAAQALGLLGVLLGWSGFMQSKIQQRSRRSLEKYMRKAGP